MAEIMRMKVEQVKTAGGQYRRRTLHELSGIGMSIRDEGKEIRLLMDGTDDRTLAITLDETLIRRVAETYYRRRI